ncbi:MAG: hypothetical protein M3271_03320 [Actinomycetota bacterium]|nr:hypothetical protein [Actinomycetota bacterium]
MRKTRLLLAGCIAALLAAPLASPAAAEDTICPETWFTDYVIGLIPAQPSEQFVEFGEGTITIRGDLAAAKAAELVQHYTSSTQTFVECLQQWATGIAMPYVDCVLERSAPIRTSPDPVARYLQVGTNLVVTIDYGQALDDAIAIANCNGIVTSGD